MNMRWRVTQSPYSELLMGLAQSSPKRVRLEVHELHSRTVPALLDGLEGEVLDATEYVVTDVSSDDVELTFVDAGEVLPDDSTLLFESGIADFGITSFTEGEVIFEKELYFEGEEYVDEGFTDERPIMPYYRTLTSEPVPGEEVVEFTSEEVDPSWLFMTAMGVPGEEVTTWDGEVLAEEIFSTEVVEDFDPSWVFMTFGGAEGEPLEHRADVPLEEQPEVAYFTTTDLDTPTVAGPVAEEVEHFIDPAVCYMADPAIAVPVGEEVVVTTAVVDEPKVSIFDLDDFAPTEAGDETLVVEPTEVLEAVEEPSVPPAAVTPAVPSTPATRTIGIDYFSIDADLLDVYFGKKKK